MEWQKQREYLDTLFEDPQANDSEIIRIYGKIIKDTNYSHYSYDVVKFLNQKADKLLEPELCKILKELRIQSHSYLLVANNLLNLEDVKYDLLNGEVLANAIPSNTLNRLKSNLGLLGTAHSMQGPTNLLVEPMLQLATLSVQEKPFNSNNVSSVQQKPPTEQKESMPLVAVAHQPQQHNIRHATTSEHDNNRLAIKIKNQCKILERLEDIMFSHHLNLKETITFTQTSTIIKRFSFGEPNQLMERPCKTILFMGETGSGKTTMINAMINYVLGVKLKDDFRFKLVNEELNQNQAHSQTQGVNVYDIHHQKGFRIPFSLTIVDTPGFGDTRGTERDNEITSAIREFFQHQNGIQVRFSKILLGNYQSNAHILNAKCITGIGHCCLCR